MYIVTVSFRDRNHGPFVEGQELDSLPDGVDWVKAGFVVETKPAPKPKRTRKQATRKG